MTGHDDSDRIDSLTDPSVLADRDDVDFREDVHDVDEADFASTEALDSHVAVGVADDRGVLLANDGHHGWTLPAFAVDESQDYLAVARREFESLTGVRATVDAVERVRCLEYRVPATDDRTVVWNVVVRATPDGALPDDPESHVDGTDARWFDGVPDGVEGPVAADAGLFVD